MNQLVAHVGAVDALSHPGAWVVRISCQSCGAEMTRANWHAPWKPNRSGPTFAAPGPCWPA